MTVRRATIEDAKEIFAIEMECFSVPWSLDSIETELLNEDKKLYYVVEDANGVVGYAGRGSYMMRGKLRILRYVHLQDAKALVLNLRVH